MNPIKRFASLRLPLVLASVAVSGAAMAQTTGGGGFDPTSGVTAFKSEFQGILGVIFPLAITIILAGVAFKLALKWIKRGTKV